MGIEKDSLLLYYVKWTFEDSGDTIQKFRILRKKDRIIDCFVDSSRAILNPEKDRTVSETVRQMSSGRTMCERKVSGNYTYPSRVGQKIIHDPIKGQKGKEL